MFFRSLFSLVKKDLKLFFRSKFSAILVLLIPLLVVLAVGYSFNSNGLSNVDVGVYSGEGVNFSSNILVDFGKHGFLTKNYSSVDDCINSVKLGNSQICSYFYLDNSSHQSVRFYVDKSRLNIADTLISSVRGSVNDEAVNLGEVSVQNLIDILNSTKKEVPKIKGDLLFVSSKLSGSRDSLLSADVLGGEFSNLLSYLQDARSASNDSFVRAKLDSAISLVNLMQAKNNIVSSAVNKSYSSETDSLGRVNSLLVSVRNFENVLAGGNIGDAKEIISPIGIDVSSIDSGSSSRDYLIPLLIAVILMFGSILLSSTFVLKDKKTKAYFRNFMTPTKDGVFIISTYITCLILISLQFAIVFLGLKYILGMSLFSFSSLVFLILFSAVTVFIFIGMFIGYLFRSEETVIFASMIVATLFIFFSNTILPLENISGRLFRFSFVNPFVSLNLALKKILLFGLNLSSIYTELIVFGIFFVVFAFLTYSARRVTRRML